ncbi:MAG: hypothetical protein RLZZ292_3084 [Bacteroidota bacterium]
MKSINWILLLIVLGSFSCDYIKEKTKPNDKVLAQVKNRELHLTELEGMLPEGISKEDSSLIINAFIARWVKDNLMMREAEQNIPKDLQIDKLVRDYRSSLVLDNYEKAIVEQQLDTAVTKQELQEFYDKNKEQYQLEAPIVRCYFMKIPKAAPDIKDVNEWWDDLDKDDLKKMTAYCAKNAALFMLNDSTWTKVDFLIPELPKGKLSNENVSEGEKTTFKDDNFYYYLKIRKVRNKREIAPFEFIQDQALKFILHQRKIKLLDNKKEELYQRELQANEVKIYTN